MKSLALSYIPDISGYTKFVTQTEIEHSKEIIAELIEIILKANTLELKISEIEGDSVLFYLMGKPPFLEEVIDQSKCMFIEFHRILKVMERDFDCPCRACCAVSDLTLKFITHYGECKEVAIGDSEKLIGSDVILAHRLLKNKVPGREYILLTEKYLENQPSTFEGQEDWMKINPNIEVLEDFGEVSTQYISLAPLKAMMP